MSIHSHYIQNCLQHPSQTNRPSMSIQNWDMNVSAICVITKHAFTFQPQIDGWMDGWMDGAKPLTLLTVCLLQWLCWGVDVFGLGSWIRCLAPLSPFISHGDTLATDRLHYCFANVGLFDQPFQLLSAVICSSHQLQILWKHLMKWLAGLVFSYWVKGLHS